MQLLLGQDVPELFSLLAATSDSHSVDSVSAKQDVVAVITRAQAHRGNVEQVVEDDTSEVGGDESTDFNPGREFADDLFEGGREEIQLTRSRKRSERRRYAAENKTGEKSKWAVLDIGHHNLTISTKECTAVEYDINSVYICLAFTYQ